MKTNRIGVVLLAATCLAGGCARVTVDQEKPIHIILDVNVKIDRELDEFFDFEKKYQPPAATQKP